MLEEMFVAVALAALGILVLLVSFVAPWLLVMVFGASVDSVSVWFSQMLPAFGLICIALSILVYIMAMKKTKNVRGDKWRGAGKI